MCYKFETLKPIMANGKVFDFFPKSGHPMIMSYKHINKEILVNEGTEEFICSSTKKKKELHSIYELRQAFEELISVEVDIINRYGTYNNDMDLKKAISSETEIRILPFRIDIQSAIMEMLINQLIFDVLYSKYCAESPRMTLRQYSLNQSYPWNGQTEKEKVSEAVRKSISSAMQKQINVMNNPELRAEIEEFGINPDEYFKYKSKVSTPYLNGEKQEIHEKPKVIWDYIYYNAIEKSITKKQYARSFRKNSNYSHADFVKIFDAYDRYVHEVFMQQTGNSRDYYLRSLDFYHLEIYKRLDFIYKLAVRMEDVSPTVIGTEHILVKRFHPYVCNVIEQNDSLKFSSTIMYYRPMLMLEESWQQQKLYNEPMYEDIWKKHHFIRAKVYELFKYHFKFKSNDYDDISDFIDKNYNILQYHEQRKVWFREDKKLKAEREARIIKALEINEALFGASDKRKPVSWTPPDFV